MFLQEWNRRRGKKIRRKFGRLFARLEGRIGIEDGDCFHYERTRARLCREPWLPPFPPSAGERWGTHGSGAGRALWAVGRPLCSGDADGGVRGARAGV